MNNPLEVTFHDIEANPKIKEVIQEKFEKLNNLRTDITKCHVFVERHSKHHQTANGCCVRLDIKIPHFEDIIVSEKCSDDVTSIHSAVIKSFKIGQEIVHERIKYLRDAKRVRELEFASAEPVED